MRRGWLTAGAFGTLACLASVVAPAGGYVPPELPWANCSGAIAAHETVLEARALPEEGAKALAGTPVTFSVPSPTLVTFALASSPALLANPNIDEGLGQALPSETGELMQVFTSSKATSIPGIVYWQVSFSATEVEGCPAGESRRVTIPPRTLTVEPAPAPPPPPAAPVVPRPVPALSATISAVPTGHPQVAFKVRCSVSCVGTAGYFVSVSSRHRKSPESALDFGPWKVAIAGSSGGVQQFTHRYTGASLRNLRHLIHDGDALEADITATVTGAAGNTAVARRTARLD
jgi:hypothetical protein